jgi:hypothetical protein
MPTWKKVCALRPGGKQKSFPYLRIVKPPLLAQIDDQSACYQPFVSFKKKLCLAWYNAISQ